MGVLYPNFRPLGVKDKWDHCSVGAADARMVLHRYGGRSELPSEAVAWFDPLGKLRRLIADYVDGYRADLKVSGSSYRLSLISPTEASA